MKKLAIMLLAAAMVISLFGCTQIMPPDQSAEETPAATDTGTATPSDSPDETSGSAGIPVEAEPYTPVELEAAQLYSCDLDGDGTSDTFMLSRTGTDEHAPYGVSVTFGGGQADYAMETYITEDRVDMWLCDLDGDGLPEIYVTGDTGSDDYITYAWRYASGAFGPVEFTGEDRTYGCADGSYLDGSIGAFDGDMLKIDSVIDMLGSYGGYRPYQYKEDGSMGPVVDTIWDLSANESVLTVASAIPVTFLDESTETAGTLDAGATLTVTASDGCSRVWFTDGGGNMGYIELTPNTDDWGYLINGIPEYDCFETLPYAG